MRRAALDVPLFSICYILPISSRFKLRTSYFKLPLSPNKTIAQVYHQATRAALLGLFVNLALGIVKLIGGIVSGSFALIADAVNSIGDVVSTVVVLIGLRIAQWPPDEEHPYGHTRAEGIAASNVALLVIISALFIAWESIQRFTQFHGIPPAWTLWIAGANVLIKEALFRYNTIVGKRTGSTALLANAWDHRSDALCSLAALVGLAVLRIGGEAFAWADELASLVIAGVIAWSGMKLFRSSASELLDVQADSHFVDAIRSSAKSVPGVEDVETLWVRKSGIEFFVDIHIEVDQERSVADGHRIGHLVKSKLLSEFVNLRDVLVHVEPVRCDMC